MHIFLTKKCVRFEKIYLFQSRFLSTASFLIKRRFLKLISFDTHSTANLPPLPMSKKNQVVLNKAKHFSRKKVRNYWINLFQLHSTENLLYFGDWNISNSKPWDMGHFRLASKREKCTCWVDDFPSISKFGQKIINWWIGGVGEEINFKSGKY